MNRKRNVRVSRRQRHSLNERANEILLWAEATKALLDVMICTVIFAIAFMLIGAGLWRYATLTG